MREQPIILIDQKRGKVAPLAVAPKGDHFEGSICLDATPPDIRKLFDLFEEIVEGQSLALLDDIEQKIAQVGLRVICENGKIADTIELQVFPSTGAVSFKVGPPVDDRQPLTSTSNMAAFSDMPVIR